MRSFWCYAPTENDCNEVKMTRRELEELAADQYYEKTLIARAARVYRDDSAFAKEELEERVFMDVSERVLSLIRECVRSRGGHTFDDDAALNAVCTGDLRCAATSLGGFKSVDIALYNYWSKRNERRSEESRVVM